MSDAPAEIDALLEWKAELDRRLGDVAVAGVQGALDLQRRLDTLLGGLSDDELARMDAQVLRLRAWLDEAAAHLEALRRLKALYRS
ncbi:MAG: hypothetical protein KIT14_09080 [bacterium]|nr:hypothetical protein [bacterium]